MVVMRGDAELEEPHEIAGKWIFVNDCSVFLKESVGLVARQEKQEKSRM